MSSGMSDEELYKLARKRVNEKRGFFIHLAIYILVNIFLIVQWAIITGGVGHPWFVWTLGGWGIGLIFHFLGVFIFSRPGQERREIEKEAEKLRKEGS